MQAIRVHASGGPEVLRYEAMPDLSPRAGHVLVALHAVGVNPVEAYRREGAQGYAPSHPYTPGSDGAGIVEAVGPGVGRLRVGDRVYLGGSVTGTYAEAALCLPEQLHPLPAMLSFEQGAALGVPYATAYRALFDRASLTAGETVFIHGATGGVGLAAVQLAVAAGARVFGSGGSEVGRALLREEGCETVVDHHDDAHFDAVLDATGGRGVDVIVEMLANVNLARDLDLLARHGRVVVVGSRGPVEITPRALMRRDADMRGMSLANATADDLQRIHDALGRGIASGAVRPLVGQRFALADAAEAHRAVMRDGTPGKIVLVPAGR